MKRRLLFAIPITAALLAMGGTAYWMLHRQKSDTTNHPTQPTPQKAETMAEANATATEDKPIESSNEELPTVSWPVTYSYADAASLEVVVNKKHKLPSDYAPTLTAFGGSYFREEAASALERLFEAARTSGVNPSVVSGYRSYSKQQEVYNNYVASDGQAQADTYSARPGHSEHQTGLAVDVDDGSGCSLDTCFGDTAFGKWLAANSQDYGFIIRYPYGKDAQTGYQYEPWHLRFVGVETAKAIVGSGKTMDEYFGVEAGGY